MSKVILVPSVNDKNKGDQALVWESVRLIKDILPDSEVKLIPDMDSGDLMTQSKQKGLEFCAPILRHPRRGRNKDEEAVLESKSSLFRQMTTAIYDFLKLSFLLLVVRCPKVCRIFFSKDINETVDLFRSSEYVFVKGGGFLHAYGGLKSTYIIWYFLFYLRLAIKLNVKVVVLPNSFGPFEGPLVSRQLKKVLSRCEIIFTREKVSQNALSKIGIKSILGPDLGFFLGENDDFDFNQIPNLNNSKIKKIGFTIRPWRFPNKNNTDIYYDKYLNSIVGIVKHLASVGHQVYFFNQSIGPNSHEDDRIAIKEVMAVLNTSNFEVNPYWVDEDYSCETLKSIYSKLDCMIGTRFHSVIFSLTSNVPCIAIAYGGNKAFGIMDAYGLSDYVIPIDKVSVDYLCHKFDTIQSSSIQLINQIESVNKTLNFERKKLITAIRNPNENII